MGDGRVKLTEMAWTGRWVTGNRRLFIMGGSYLRRTTASTVCTAILTGLVGIRAPAEVFRSPGVGGQPAAAAVAVVRQKRRCRWVQLGATAGAATRTDSAHRQRRRQRAGQTLSCMGWSGSRSSERSWYCAASSCCCSCTCCHQTCWREQHTSASAAGAEMVPAGGGTRPEPAARHSQRPHAANCRKRLNPCNEKQHTPSELNQELDCPEGGVCFR